MASALTKSKLIGLISKKIARIYKKDNERLSARDVELAVKSLIDYMADTLAEGERIEIRGFGSFSLHFRAPRVGRNPKTGAIVKLEGKYVPHFKSGKKLRERVNRSVVDVPDEENGGERDAANG